MRVNQEPSFKPIVITLDTREEAEAFWGIVLDREKSLAGPEKALAIKISNWFTEKYR